MNESHNIIKAGSSHKVVQAGSGPGPGCVLVAGGGVEVKVEVGARVNLGAWAYTIGVRAV